MTVHMSATGRVGPIIASIVLLLALGSRAAPPSGAGFTDGFEGGGGLADRGWEVKAKPEQSQWSIRDGGVKMVGHRNPYKGGLITKKIPLLERGTLEFDAKFATSGHRDYRHFSLGFRLYGHVTAFKNYGTHTWLQYRPHEKRWGTLATGVALGKWVHIKIVFDFPAKRAEYYCGAGADPVFVDPALELDLSQAPAELVFFNYGLCNGTVTNWIDNVTLSGAPEAGPASSSSRDGLVLFEGLTAERYAVRQSLRAEFAADKTFVYPLMTRGAATAPSNILRLQSVPGRQRWQQAALIVLADTPTTPNACLPPYLLQDLVSAVEEGAHLLILGGMFSLGKGGYQDTALTTLLPVGSLGLWEGKCFDKPMPLMVPRTARDGTDLAGGTVLWHHDCDKLAEGTEILLEAGGKPMAVRRTFGKGAVTVFLGMTCGDFAAVDATPFWKSPQWRQILRGLATLDRRD
ncbi:MAG: hypothetical protein KAI66_16600 [Lentisphaeria bacterium]|nr:hypothetical protein [Lentisphaeria bacterium]